MNINSLHQGYGIALGSRNRWNTPSTTNTGAAYHTLSPRFGNQNRAGKRGLTELGRIRQQISSLIEQVQAQATIIQRLENEKDLSGLARRVVPATVAITASKTPQVDIDYVNSMRQLTKPSGFKMNPIGKYGKLMVDNSPAPEMPTIPQLSDVKAIAAGFWVNCQDGMPRILTNASIANLDTMASNLFAQAMPGIPVKLGETLYNGNLNFVQNQEAVETDRQPQSVPLRLAMIPGTNEPAISSSIGIALLEAADDSFYERTPDSRLNLPGGIQPLELDDNFQQNQPGHKVISVNNMPGAEGSLTEGTISRFRKIGHSHPVSAEEQAEVQKAVESLMLVQTTLPVSPMDNGSPLVNTSGKVVGLNFSAGGNSLSAGSGIGLAIAATAIRNELKKWGFIQ